MNRTKRIEFIALWSGELNNRAVTGCTKFSLELDTGIDYNRHAIGYLNACARVLGISEFFVKEVCHDVG